MLVERPLRLRYDEVRAMHLLCVSVGDALSNPVATCLWWRGYSLVFKHGVSVLVWQIENELVLWVNAFKEYWNAPFPHVSEGE